MKRDNDDSFTWPFTEMVILELLNQLEPRTYTRSYYSQKIKKLAWELKWKKEHSMDMAWQSSSFTEKFATDPARAANTLKITCLQGSTNKLYTPTNVYRSIWDILHEFRYWCVQLVNTCYDVCVRSAQNFMCVTWKVTYPHATSYKTSEVLS